MATKKRKKKRKVKKRARATRADNGGPVGSVAPPPSLPTESAAAATSKEPPPPKRNAKGQWLPGQSGNPKGLPPGTKNYLVQMRRNTEIALREYLDSPARRKKALAAVDRLFTICVEGEEKNAVGALKLLMDKLIPSPRPEEPDTQGPRNVTIVVENKTRDHQAPIEVIELPPKDFSPRGLLAYA